MHEGTFCIKHLIIRFSWILNLCSYRNNCLHSFCIYSLHLCLEWKTSPPLTHLNHLPLLLHNPPNPQSYQRTPLFPLQLSPLHLTLSTPSLHHKTLTVLVIPCHIHLGITTSCRFTIIPKEGPTMGRVFRHRPPTSPHKVASNQASFYKDLEEERATRTKNKGSNYGTVWNVMHFISAFTICCNCVGLHSKIKKTPA